MTDTAKNANVSPNNPCPFLRALVSQGVLPDAGARIGEVTETLVKVGKTGEGSPTLPAVAIRLIALAANGLSPRQLWRNGQDGVGFDALRNGPLDKKGVGSGILAADASVNEAELNRLDEFATDMQGADGRSERGLGAAELKRMMDANYARAKGRRRLIDRSLMDGEWPVLLQVMGKPGKNGRYLSVAEVRQLFRERKLPERMMGRLHGG